MEPSTISQGDDFEESTADPCFYNLNDGKVLLLLYVDGILLARMNENRIRKIINLLEQKFETADLGNAKFLHGIDI